MPRVRWWSALALVLAVVLVGVAMPAFLTPDPARAVAKLAADVARLESVVRRGKPAANMRDLKDGNLFDAEDGQVPVYNAATGTWRPGAAGASYALYEDSAGTSASDFNSTRIPFDTLTEESGSHGITVGTGANAGIFTLPPGLYTVTANIFFVPNATGFREIHVTGTVSIAGLTFPPKLRVPAIATASERSELAISTIVRSAAGADQLWIFGLQNSGGALNTRGRSIAFLRHS